MKKFFKLNKFRRLFILGVTLVAAILAVTLGSFYNVSKNVKKGLEYGGGAEYVVRIDSSDTSSDVATDVAEAIYERIDNLGVAGADITTENGNQVRVTYPGATTPDQMGEIESLITDKPHLVFTDVYGNPLFDHRGSFNPRLAVYNGQDPKRFVMGSKYKYSESKVPLVSGAAKPQYSGSKYEVGLQIQGNKTQEWTAATNYISSLTGHNEIIAWLDLDNLIDIAQNDFPADWNLAQHDPWNFIHVTNATADSDKKANILKQHQFNAKKFMISSASVKEALSGTNFVISGNFDLGDAQQLSREINYGSSDYSLTKLQSSVVPATYGSNAFNKAMIAGIVVFAVIALFLIANYGLLGALTTISLALYVYLILQLFTIMRGEYSPETIAALVIGIGMGIDANIITYERLKTELYGGASLEKSFARSNKKSFTTIFDANITTLIVALVLFYFGTRSIVGLSVTLILSIVFTLVIMLAFTRLTSTMLVKSGMFDNRKHLLGVKPKFDVKVQKKIDSIDYIKSSKWFAMSSAIVMGAGLITMGITAGIAGNIDGGFNLSQEFVGGTRISISNATNPEQVEALVDELESIYKVPSEDIDLSSDHKSVTVESKVVVRQSQLTANYKTDSKAKKLHSLFEEVKNNQNGSYGITSPAMAEKMVRDAMLAIIIAMALIVIYTLIRFRWTYSFAAIVALVHDGLIVTAVFIMTRIQISPVFIAGLLSILGYSINDTIVTFDRIREKMAVHTGDLTRDKVRSIANEAVRDTLKRSILTSLTTIMAVIVLMCFGNATKFSFNFAMLIGLLAGTYSSIFIATYLWTKLEMVRQKGITRREKKKFWETPGVEEQSFDGINDYTA